MNALFLIGMAVIAFFFGYRFFAKLLAFGIFGSVQTNYSTGPAGAADARGLPNRHLLFIHHAIILTSGVTVVGGVVALAFGWIPALLWLVIGATVAGGTLNFGTLWLAGQRRGQSLFDLASTHGGRLVGSVATATAALTLVLLAALCTLIAARLFTAEAASVLPVVVVVVMALLLGRMIAGRIGLDVLPITVIALIAVLALMWFGAKVPFSFSGALNLDVSGEIRFSLGALAAWVLLAVVFGLLGSRARRDRLAQPYALLNALLVATVLIVMLVGLMVAQPAMTTPEFFAPADAPGVFPWLFVLLCSGAVAGVAFVASHGETAPRLSSGSDARYVGYGGALMESTVALSAIVLGGVAYTDAEIWKQHFGQWPTVLDIGQAAAIYLDGFVRLAGALDIDSGFSRTIAATVLIGLCLTTLEASMRVLTVLLAPVSRELALPPARDTALRRGTTAAVVALVTLFAATGSGGALLLTYGGVSLLLAAVALGLLAAGLRAAARPVFVALLPMAFLALLTVWVVIELMLGWWQTDRWVLFIAAGVALAVIGAVGLAMARVFRVRT